jgi:uncharacterized protein YbjT (DUF2867 family)
MPPKRWKYPVTSYDVPQIDPADRHANTDQELVRYALVDFEELDVLADATREQLIGDLAAAVRYARAGVKTGKVGVSNEATTQQVYVADVGRAMERAGLDPTRWRKQYDNGGPESLYFRIAREVAEVTGLPPLPKDPKLVGQRASQIQYITPVGGDWEEDVTAQDSKIGAVEAADK